MVNSLILLEPLLFLPTRPRIRPQASVRTVVGLSRVQSVVVVWDCVVHPGKVLIPMPAHRRHLTIMSCDIVNSTVYADAMDPEDFEILMTNFFETSKAVVERHRGAFAHHTGDGFTAYFGSPRTQGRNAQEAIECGLAVVEALSRLTVGEGSELLVRIGIATGLVVFSTINRQNNSSDFFAVGASVHLAARIQSLAAPGSVWVDLFTYDLAQRNFEFTDRGTHLLKGFSETKHVWEAGPPRALEFRFEERQEHLTPFVGRVRELQALDECWRLVEQGTGQAALISGEPGIGKSRFVFEFIKRVASQPPLVFQCLEDHENEPLHPLINHMRHLAQIVLNEPIEERRRKAGKFLDESFPGLGLLRPVVLSLIAQDGDELDMQYDSNPAYKFNALRSTIVDLAVVLKGESSRIVVVEDVQWIDPSSEEVLTSLIERAHQLRMLVIATSRNEGTLSKASLPLKRLPIVRLSTVEAVNLANHVFKGMTIGETVLGSVVERSDGIPLYVEEMARAVSETVRAKGSATLDEQDGGETSDGHMPIPDTLHGTLLARLDGLGEAGELAQIASVMGQEFDVKVLSKLAGWPAEALQRNLGTLVEFRRGQGAARRGFRQAGVQTRADPPGRL